MSLGEHGEEAATVGLSRVEFLPGDGEGGGGFEGADR